MFSGVILGVLDGLLKSKLLSKASYNFLASALSVIGSQESGLPTLLKMKRWKKDSLGKSLFLYKHVNRIKLRNQNCTWDLSFRSPCHSEDLL